MFFSLFRCDKMFLPGNGSVSYTHLMCIRDSRKDSPLIVGETKDGNIIASDVPAVLKYTRDVIFIEKMCIRDRLRNVLSTLVEEHWMRDEAVPEGAVDCICLLYTSKYWKRAES